MSLSCHCDYDGDSDWYWYHPQDYSILDTKRSRKCSSCGERIVLGATCSMFARSRCATEWEDARGFGAADDPESIPMAPGFLCERCADLFFSLNDLGFECVSPYEDQRELVKEYHHTYGKRFNGMTGLELSECVSYCNEMAHRHTHLHGMNDPETQAWVGLSRMFLAILDGDDA